MLKRIRDLFGRREKGPSREAASLPDTGGDKKASANPVGSPPEGVVSALPPVHRGPAIVHHPIPASDLDPDAVKIVRRLTRFDHTAYLVGGCVRDLLLERRPKDFDVGTSATPRQVRRLFGNCRIIGRRFRLAHIYYQNGKIIEVATFRARDVDEEDSPNPASDILIRDDNVFGTPEDDALRRDFTINALFYDVNAETVLDHADGLGDLRRRLVRTIGDPEIRFREDPIRILRAIKFAARLDFDIEAGTLDAMRRTAKEIPKAAASRVLEEINRFCRGGAAKESFRLMRETGVFEVVLPELVGGYREDPAREKLVSALLAAMDRRHAEEHEASTGEILTALLLPLIAPKLGWTLDGKAMPSRGRNVRELADEHVRPVALRLRVPRRDQEQCRQILMTLSRMVPAHGARRSLRQSILRRTCLADALWMLGAMAEHLGGDFSQAYETWAREAAPAAGGSERAPAETESETPEPRRKKARRRRSPRRKTAPEETPARTAERVPEPGSAPAVSSRRVQPSRWDDEYFFAALPSASSVPAEKGRGDRYGADALAGGQTPETAGEDQTDPDEQPPQNRRRRRPRRRRRARPRGGGESGADSSEGSSEE